MTDVRPDDTRPADRQVDGAQPDDAPLADPLLDDVLPDDVVLAVRDLAVGVDTRADPGPRRRRHPAAPVPIVHGVDLTVHRGETVAVVGESGSGKSVTMLAALALLTAPLRVTRGRVRLRARDGAVHDLTTLPERALRRLRGQAMAVVHQDPMTSLSPFLTVADQVTEAMTVHGTDRATARARTRLLLDRVGLPAGPRIERSYPHELSGGMRQRVGIAMALAARPVLLVADEPTTALDVTVQQQILGLVDELTTADGLATVWVTHDLGVVAQLADRVVVVYAGRVVEDAAVRDLFAAPQHPYTAALLAALPDGPTHDGTDTGRGPLPTLPGRPPQPGEASTGCAFAPRCPRAADRCATTTPPLLARGTGASGSTACWFPLPAPEAASAGAR